MPGRLAALGGTPVRTQPFARRRTMHEAEKAAVLAVMESDNLSGFMGAPGPHAFGGPEVLAFEADWARTFNARHAISVNSWSTGLTTCVGALGLGPGDEMICPPFTMSASAACALPYGVVPVFVDIEPGTFCLDPARVEEAITSRTRAIMVVHLFGLAADMGALLAVARKHGLFVIEDAAQAPLATYGGELVGALGDIGGFSLNYHKHIHTGEGGVIVSNDDDLALRAKLIRNHAENFIEDQEISDLTNMVGTNYRLTELQAAIGRVQLDRIAGIVAWRQKLASHLCERIDEIPGLTGPTVPAGRTHSWYLFPILFDAEVVGIDRETFVKAVEQELPSAENAEGRAVSNGYVRPLHLAPLYQQQRAIGSLGFPFPAEPLERYRAGACPVAEGLHATDLMLSSLVRDPLTEGDMDDLAEALAKVVAGAGALVGER